MKILFPIVCLLYLWPSSIFSQEVLDTTTVSVDSLYREDQFYVGFNYNFLTGMSGGLDRSGFSGGLHLGYIRDMPLNERRNVSLGLGLGWSVNTYGQTLFIGEDLQSGESIFINLDALDIDYDRNRFSLMSLEVPLQLRWRTSSFVGHRFWRIYPGLKFGYVHHFKSVFEQVGNAVSQTEVPEFNRWRLGATLAFGYNTFNFHIYYSLSPFFKDSAQIDGQKIELNSLQIGLVFYIL